MQTYAIKTDQIKPGDNLVKILLQSIEKNGLKVEDGDVIAVSSKALATAQNRIVNLNDVSPSENAMVLARKHDLKLQLAELILQEAEEIVGGTEKAVLTLKNGFLTVNAGVDQKNVPENHAVLWPRDPQRDAAIIRNRIVEKTGKKVGVLILDSDVAPLKLGTRGVAIAVAGFNPVEDCRGQLDLYGKPLVMTFHAVADDLASSAHLLMGETNEKTPFVLIKNAPITIKEEKVSLREMRISHEKCVYMSTLRARARAHVDG